MNRIYRLVWDRARKHVVVASELARGHGAGSSVTVGSVALPRRGTRPIAMPLAPIVLAVASMFAIPTAFAAPIGCTDGGVGGFQCGPGTSAGTSTSTAVGENATATQANGIAIGSGAQATTGSSAIAIGSGAKASSSTPNGDSLAIGNAAVASGQDSMALGGQTTASGTNSIAIGNNFTQAATDGSVVIGVSSTATMGSNATVLGTSAKSTGNSTTAVGVSSSASADGGSAIGAGSTASGVNSVALGASTSAAADNSTALGSGSFVQPTQTGSVAIGQYANLSDSGASAAQYSISIGTTDAAHPNDPAWSTQVKNGAQHAVAIGSNNLDVNSDYAIGIGGDTTYVTGLNSIGIGRGVQTNGDNTIAVGTGATASGLSSLAIGTGNVVTGNNSGAFGDPNNVSGTGSYAVGNNNTIANDNSFVLGNGVTTTQDNSVVLGNASTDRAATTETNSTVGGITYGSYSGTPTGVVSVGAAGAERQLINVAPGAVNATSTDAINGSQLYATQVGIGNLASSTATALGGGAGVNADGSLSAPSYTVQGGSYHDVGSAISALNNSSVQYDNPATKDKITLGGTTSSDGGVTNGTTITNLHQGAVNAGSTDAINGTQLYDTSSSLASALGGGAAVNADGTVSAPNYSVNGTTYHDVGHAISAATTHYVSINDGGTLGGNFNDNGATGTNAVAIGVGSSASGTGSLAVGTRNTVTGNYSGAFGDPNNISGSGSYVVGNNNTVANNHTFVLGNGVTTTQDNSVVLGNASTDRAATTETNSTVGGITYGSYSGTPTGVVSVGAAGAERQLINVAPGAVNATSTDAINGSQLYATQVGIGNLASSTATALGGGAGVNADGSLSAPSYSVSGMAYNNVGDAINAIANAPNPALGLGATASGADGAAYGHNASASGASSTAIGSGATASADNSVALGAGSVANRANTVSVGAPGAARQITNVAAGTAPTDAVNLDQLDRGLSTQRTFAARGIAAALAQPSLPQLSPQHQWVGLAVGTYAGEQALGGAYEYQINKHFNFGVGVSAAVTGGSDVAGRAQLGYGW